MTATSLPAKQASPGYPIQEFLADRWSPYGFADRPVPEADLSSWFEAARWAAVHDLGLASANLVVEATSRGLSVHQMIGILPDRARELYQIPEQAEAWTAMAVGYKASANGLPDGLRERDLAPRHRKPTRQFVFTGSWGVPSPLAQPVPGPALDC